MITTDRRNRDDDPHVTPLALGGQAKAAEAFDLRYHAASRRHLDEVDPRALASFLVDTTLGTVTV